MADGKIDITVLQLKSTFGLVLVSLGMLVPAASATTITFGTGGTSGLTTGGTTSVAATNVAGVSGLNLTVTAGNIISTCTPTCLVTASASGYGVSSGTGDSADIDNNPLDTLTLTFNQTVTLTGITFGNWDNNDNSGIYNGGVLVTTYSDNTGVATISATGTTFEFRATGPNDDYQVRSIDFTVAATPTPEPATLGMMGLALLGIGVGARKGIKRK